MKKIFFLLLIAAAAFACHRKSVPAQDIVISNTPSDKKPEPSSNSTAASASEDAKLGATVYTTRCGRCHALKPVEKYTVQQWDNILKSMIPKAGLNDAQARQVTAYVQEHAKK